MNNSEECARLEALCAEGDAILNDQLPKLSEHQLEELLAVCDKLKNGGVVEELAAVATTLCWARETLRRARAASNESAGDARGEA